MFLMNYLEDRCAALNVTVLEHFEHKARAKRLTALHCTLPYCTPCLLTSLYHLSCRKIDVYARTLDSTSTPQCYI